MRYAWATIFSHDSDDLETGGDMGKRGKSKREKGMKQVKRTVSLWLVLTVSLWLPTAFAQHSPTPDSRPQAPLVETVDAIGMTVDDMDRSLEFYIKVLSFELVSDVEVYGTPYEQLQG